MATKKKRVTVMDMNDKAPKGTPKKTPPKKVEKKAPEPEPENTEALELAQQIRDTRALKAATPANNELDQNLDGLEQAYRTLTGETVPE